MILEEKVILNNGVEIPKFGLGVFRVSDENAIENVKKAIINGYRLIDTAAIYRNEEGVGKGIKEALKETNLKREDIFITSKVWNNHLTYEETLEAYNESLRKLDLDYLDLYLIHWPGKDAFRESYKALETLYKEGKVRAIGVCNFEIEHIKELESFMSVKPVLNQIEFHPKLTQNKIRNYCLEKNIKIQSWSPLMQGKILDNEVLKNIANKYNKDVAQIIFKWNIQNEILLLTKTEREERLISNFDIDDFVLSDEEMDVINNLNENLRVGPDPFEFDLK